MPLRLQDGQEDQEPDEFFDALASIRRSVSSFVTSTAASLRSLEPGDEAGSRHSGLARSGSLANTSGLQPSGSGPLEASR